jgi:hypothetical protein
MPKKMPKKKYNLMIELCKFTDIVVPSGKDNISFRPSLTSKCVEKEKKFKHLNISKLTEGLVRM